ncbi:ABC transporter ATP-binding protein [Yinghuangia aomiensis]|uniref:ABC transporter ATP-binding protein n=1 Tax=Yinghuangia aomiensis TaxID=676205 RepID=A0ABP9H3H5_9ACTN
MTDQDGSEAETASPELAAEELKFSFRGLREESDIRKAISIRSIGGRLPQLIRRSLTLAWRVDRRAVVLLLTFQVLSALLEAFGLLATTRTITELIASGHIADRVQAALPSVLAIATAAALRTVLGIGINMIGSDLEPRIARRAEWMMLEAATEAELSAYDTPGFNDAWDAADRGAVVSPDLVLESQSIMSSAASLLAAAGVLTVLHPVLLPLLLLAVVPQGVAAVAATRENYLSNLEMSADRRALSHLRWHLADKEYADQVRSDTMAPFLLAKYRRHGERVDARVRKSVRTGARYAAVGALMGGAGATLVWGAVVLLLSTGRMSVASAGTAVIALGVATTGLRGIVNWSARLFRTGLYVDDWADFIAKAGGYALARGAAAPPAPDVIRVEGATYGYPDAAKLALDKVDFHVRRGEVVALVGENGSGKTTLAKLIAGLYLPTDGEVTWDGVSTRDLDPHALWAQTSVVPQKVARWPLTARESITLGREDESGDGTILDAAAASGASDVLNELRRGLETLLAPEFWGGQDLSGGQWQRIALARAFYRRAPLLVLDEPTSALDPRAEHRIFAGLRAMAADCAIVLVTHRLTNVAVADRIVVLDHGCVLQEGTFTELTTTPGLFQELWRLQNDRASLPDQRAAQPAEEFDSGIGNSGQ